MADRMFECCICGKVVINSYGNNPWPVNNEANTRCCDDCNSTHVIPARLQMLMNKDKKESYDE